MEFATLECVDWLNNRRQLSVVESTEQTKDGFDTKIQSPAKPAQVFLSSTDITELKAYRARQAEEQIRLGLRPDGDSFVVA